MEKLWHYLPDSGFTNRNAGFSMWCFGKRKGKDYFIKQFLSPKYPTNPEEMSEKKLASKQKECEEFVRQKTALYKTLNRFSDGNDVRVTEFFRVDSRFYIAMEKINALPWTVESVAALDEQEKRRLCAIIAHAVAALHKGGMVHSDIKHDNILFTETAEGVVTAKIIDFDGSFLESSPPSMEEEVTGDTNYFSPEVCARAYGEERSLTCKLDVFALGVLFHQYFSGQLPGFAQESAYSPGEAVLRGEPLALSKDLPEDIASLIGQMLLEKPEERPTAEQVFESLRPKPDEEDADRTAEHEAEEESPGSSFYRPGGL